MAELRGTKSRLLIAEIRRLGGGPFTHEDLYKQSPAIQKEFTDAIAVSRRLSDLYGSGDMLDRVSQKRENGRKQYAYSYRKPELLGSPKPDPAQAPAAAPAGSDHSQKTSLQAAREAMGLPKKTQPGAILPPVNPVLTATEAPSRKDPAPAKKPADRPVSSPTREPDQALPAYPEDTEVPTHSAPDPLSHILTGIFSDLICQLIDELAPSLHKALTAAPRTEQVREAIQRALQPTEAESWTEEEPVEDTERPKADSADHLRVLIVGLLGQQAESLKQVFKDRLKLQFWNEDRANDQLKQLVENAQVVIGATKFISHAIDGVLTRSENYIRVHGGVSKIRLELSHLLRNPAKT